MHWRVARKRLARRDPNRKIIIHISAAHITAHTRALAPRKTPLYRRFHPDTARGFPAVSIRASLLEREAGAANLHFSCLRFQPLVDACGDARRVNGSWVNSDLYAFGGVMDWRVRGNKPLEAAARVRQDIMPPGGKASEARVYTPELLAAIDWALKPHDETRRAQGLCA